MPIYSVDINVFIESDAVSPHDIHVAVVEHLAENALDPQDINRITRVDPTNGRELEVIY